MSPVTLVRSPTLTKMPPGGGIDHRLEAREAGRARALGEGPRTDARDRRRDRRGVRGRGAAARAGDVQQAAACPFAQGGGHLFGRLVVAAELVRQAGVGVGDQRQVGDAPQQVDMLAQLLRPERAVEPDDERPRMPDRVPERLQGLAGQRSSRGVDDRAADDERHVLAALLQHRADREDRRLRVERVEDRLDEEEVGAAVEQALARSRRYACSSSGHVTFRAAGSLTSGDREAVRFVGPREPAT